MTDFLHDLVGSMSQGAAGNPTVAMIEAAFAHHGLHWRYVNMEITPADLGAAVRGAKAMGFRGFNCSLPHKVAVIEHLDGLGESASVMGAVNCVVRRDDKLIGENTDGKGFLKSLETVTDPRGKSVVLFGAGGASRAIAVELGLAGVRKITVVNRSEARGSELVELLRTKLNLDAELVIWTGDHAVPEGSDIVINGTSIGLYDGDARLAVDTATLTPDMVVADVIFSPPRTRLLRDAGSRGCKTLDGLGMLVNQGIVGVQFWTGIEPDAEVMRKALEKALGL
ncbi:MAG: shikimate dehydrogenase [Verrucomicrobia bacterium]|nr:shikimate dehydrogenase [Verrucomicrobiota bacterium]MDA1004873.1 shikimate dehydrogenase [Verrucomicrobiota bacterium]